MEKRTIVVKDKNKNVIAVFSNEQNAESEESARNMMVSPTIDIVQNGDSTLSFQMLKNSEKWKQIKNPENRYYCNGRVYTALNEQSYSYQGPVVNVTLVEEWYLLDHVFVQAHNVDTKIEALDEHTVKILPKTSTEFKLTVNGTQYNDSNVKDSRGVVMPRGSAGYALWAILKGTDWSLGVCDVIVDGFDAANDYGTFNVESDMKDVLYNIKMIQELYGGVLIWDSENHVVHLRDETKPGTDFNTWKGFVLKYRKNLKEHPIVTYDNNLITRLYPLGNGNLNIKNVNDGKNYIDNFSYTNTVYSSYLQNENIYDTNSESGQKCLLQWGKRQLEKYCKPRKSISYSIVDTTEVQGVEFSEPFDVNDVVKAYYTDDSDNEICEDLRITHININWFYPSDSNVIEVGDKISNEVEVFYEIYKAKQNSVPTDSRGNISSNDVYIEVPDYYYNYLDDYYGNEPGYGSAHGGYGSVSMSDMINLHVEKSVQLDDGIAKNEAGITLVADDLKAQVVLEASHYEETSNGISQNKASITTTANELGAQIQLEASHYSETKNGIVENSARITTTANELYAQVQLEAAHYSELSQNIASLTETVDDVSSVLDGRASGSIGGTAYVELYQDPSGAVASIGCVNGGEVNITSDVRIRANYIALLSSEISILGHYVTFNSQGYLVSAG